MRDHRRPGQDGSGPAVGAGRCGSPCWKLETPARLSWRLVHPATMRLLDPLETKGTLCGFALRGPHGHVHSNGRAVTYIDFSDTISLPLCRNGAQWDLLVLLAEAAQANRAYAADENRVTGVQEGGKVAGVRYQGAEGPGGGGIDRGVRRPMVDRPARGGLSA